MGIGIRPAVVEVPSELKLNYYPKISLNYIQGGHILAKMKLPVFSLSFH